MRITIRWKSVTSQWYEAGNAALAVAETDNLIVRGCGFRGVFSQAMACQFPSHKGVSLTNS